MIVKAPHHNAFYHGQVKVKSSEAKSSQANWGQVTSNTLITLTSDFYNTTLPLVFITITISVNKDQFKSSQVHPSQVQSLTLITLTSDSFNPILPVVFLIILILFKLIPVKSNQGDPNQVKSSQVRSNKLITLTSDF